MLLVDHCDRQLGCDPFRDSPRSDVDGTSELSIQGTKDRSKYPLTPVLLGQVCHTSWEADE